MRKFSFLTAGLAALMVALAPIASQAAEVVVKLASAAAGDHIFVHMSNLMKKEVEKRAPGKVDWKLFPGGQLGKDQDVITGLTTGTHIATLQASWIAAAEPKFTLFEAPFFFGNRSDVQKVVAAVEGDIRKSLEKKGIILVGIGELGFRQISNNVRPIVKPTDLNGVKLRTPGNPFRVKTFRTFGANPTPMAFPEVFVALRQGVIDGQENPLASIWGGKFHEVQKFISISNHVFTPTSILFSKKHWDSWPADVRKAIREAAQLAVQFSYKYGTDKDKSLEQRMKGQNPNIKFNAIDTPAFRKLAQPLYADLEKKVGKELWGKVVAAVK